MNVLRQTTIYGYCGLILCLPGVLCETSAQEPASLPKVEELLPADGATLDVMQLVSENPKRMDELAKKLAKAAAKDPAWWAAHLKKAKPGEPAPYDARLGVAREEYDEFLSLSKNLVYKKATTIKVNVKRDGNRIILEFGDQLPNLKEIELDLKKDTVKTPYGAAADHNTIAASEGQRATGPWNGIQWKLRKVEEEPARSTTVQFAVGMLKASGRGIIYYRVVQVGQKSPANISHLLQYDLKRAP